MKIRHLLVFILIIIGLGLSPRLGLAQDNSVQSTVIKEGNDFATRLLLKPWDMDVYTDISHWINHAGASNYINNIAVDQGKFSGTASGNYSEFYVLFPGYQPGMNQTGTGVITSIPSSQYKCFYMAMKAEIPEVKQYYWNIGWVEDRSVDWGSGDWGKTYGNKVINNQWTLYQMDLSTWPYQSGDSWNSLSHWQGLRVTPIMQRPNTTFHVDWVRLTDCAPVNYTISGLSNGAYSLWLGTGSPERQILVQELVVPDANGSYQWDVQGLEPGDYTYYLKDAQNNVVQQGQISIEPAPIPTFTNPSPFTGKDYATSHGNSWDTNDIQDVTAGDCTNYAIVNDILSVDTPSPGSLPRYCVGSVGEADPKLYLNTPIADDISDYRYLSFRHDLEGFWAVPDEGMMIRWIWEMSGLAPKPCKYVSREIALDVGWNTYWVDLHDPRNGSPIEVGGLNASSCPFPINWKTTPGTLSQFRLDPNENVFSTTMHQEFDWIRLTKVPSVIQGTPFTIQVSMSKSVDTIQSITYYYTTDVRQPTQHPAEGNEVVQGVMEPANSVQVTEAPYQIFLPMSNSKFVPPVTLAPVENEIRYQWDTSSVPVGEYYLCAVTSDGYNRTTVCSQAPVQVEH